MLRNKRGIAIETALFMMVVVFALCTLLLTFALYSRNQNVIANDRFESLALTEQIGEDFYYSVKNNESMDTGAYTDRSVTVSEEADIITLVVTDSNNGDHLLTVVILRKDGGDVSILRWSRFSGE